jgi:hypothetical protein
MEGVLAAFAQFDNDVRSDRTRAGMQEALRRGRWTFLGPLGYLNAPRAMRQSLIPDPERPVCCCENRLYIGIIDVPEFGVRDQRSGFAAVTW